MPIPAELKDVRDLFTATEYGLLEASYEEAPAAELKKKLTLARTLRDKWKDQYTRQRRARQQSRGGRAGAENDRSHAKLELFTEAVRRFEALLAAAPTAAPAAAKAARKKATKTGRTRAHRQERVTTRKTLELLRRLDLPVLGLVENLRRDGDARDADRAGVDGPAADRPAAGGDL